MKAKGLGDTIEQFTKMTGIKTLTQLVSSYLGKEDCGCDHRKEVLNILFPYKKR
jgi:hypothetical protein